ncbi:hypothetical protein JOD55_000628 [Arcanobacterium pluranimalium]|uniref:DUF501 domain-containing protein n=1 Tax=Arcanobacterium pluranimalium TaxID=108028 RepID=UPI00195ABF0B|nr:DUF501 domain-containing protein [Arcanobacterium pluranimalium]MBM7824801.1 hypothetical protein [Arcanobacterium pluranimalium]
MTVSQKRDISLELLQKIACNASLVGGNDREILTEQLGRDPRGLVGIGARCACGAPAVTITYPRLPDGSPFPTLFYLSLPSLVKEISRIESAGGMAPFNERLHNDADLLASHEQAHQSYVERRDLLEVIPELGGKSAGGMPDRVKCLHALAGYALAVGRGVCPIGDEALDMAGWDPEVCRCKDVADDE